MQTDRRHCHVILRASVWFAKTESGTTSSQQHAHLFVVCPSVNNVSFQFIEALLSSEIFLITSQMWFLLRRRMPASGRLRPQTPTGHFVPWPSYNHYYFHWRTYTHVTSHMKNTINMHFYITNVMYKYLHCVWSLKKFNAMNSCTWVCDKWLTRTVILESHTHHPLQLIIHIIHDLLFLPISTIESRVS